VDLRSLSPQKLDEVHHRMDIVSTSRFENRLLVLPHLHLSGVSSEVMDLVEGRSVLHNLLIKDDNIPQEWIDTIKDQTNWESCDSF